MDYSHEVLCPLNLIYELNNLKHKRNNLIILQDNEYFFSLISNHPFSKEECRWILWHHKTQILFLCCSKGCRKILLSLNIHESPSHHFQKNLQFLLTFKVIIEFLILFYILHQKFMIFCMQIIAVFPLLAAARYHDNIILN